MSFSMFETKRTMLQSVVCASTGRMTNTYVTVAREKYRVRVTTSVAHFFTGRKFNVVFNVAHL